MSLVAGPIGTSVTLELADPTMSQTNEFIVKRVHIKLPNDILIHND
jgi:biotin-(acetyl-CoA carboxylase) ligase